MTEIIDNTPDRVLVDVLKNQIKKSKEAKFAIGYFFLSGFSLVKEVYGALVSDREVRAWIERVQGHAWVKVVEGE